MAKPGTRPISPHLGIYRRGPHMIASIIHRIAGDGLAIVGTLVLLAWLGSLAGGMESYAKFTECMNSIFGRIILIGLSWAFFSHLTTGLRHFVLDTGAGYELKANRMWAVAVLILPLLLTAAFWLFIFFGKGL